MSTICVFDLSSLYFERPAPGLVQVCAGTGEVLAVAETCSADDREAALAACDAALSTGKVSRPDPLDPTQLLRVSVALYNPYTAQIAVGPLPNTAAYTDGVPLDIDAAGVLATRADRALAVACRLLYEPERTRESLRAMFSAHRR